MFSSRLLLLTLAVLFAFTGTATAEVAGNASTKTTQAVSKTGTARTFNFPGDVDWFRVQLAKGSDYYVTVGCIACSFDLRDQSGKVAATGHFFIDGSKVPAKGHA